MENIEDTRAAEELKRHCEIIKAGLKSEDVQTQQTFKKEILPLTVEHLRRVADDLDILANEYGN